MACLPLSGALIRSYLNVFRGNSTRRHFVSVVVATVGGLVVEALEGSDGDLIDTGKLVGRSDVDGFGNAATCRDVLDHRRGEVSEVEIEVFAGKGNGIAS